MYRQALLLVLGVLFVGGCVGNALLSDNVDWAAILDQLTQGSQNPPAVSSGAVRVELVNASAYTAEARITMRVAGEQVHYSLRDIAAGREDTVVGPDRADSVLVEASYDVEPAYADAARAFFLGTDFDAGDTLRITLAGPPSEPNEPSDPNDTTSPNRPVVAITGLDSDVRAVAGNTVTFAIATSNATGGTLAAFADPDGTPDSGDEITIVSDEPAAETVPVNWVVPELTPGAYPIYAELTLDGELTRSPAADGRVLINTPPQLTFDSPRPEQAVLWGTPLIVSWAGVDPDDNATIAIYVNAAPEFDGYERLLRDGISEDNISDREYALDTSELYTENIYYIIGVIADPFGETQAIAGPFYVTYRLVGRYTPDTLPEGRLTTITGGAESRRFGTAVSCTRSLNVADDGLADLVVGDPGAFFRSPSAPESPADEYGAVYYFQSPGYWPPSLTANEADLFILGEQPGSETGARVAFAEGFEWLKYPSADIVLGAPQYENDGTPPTGQGYRLYGDEMLLTTRAVPPYIDLAELPYGPGIRIQGEYASSLGRDIADVGDLDGYGVSDFAIGATYADANEPNSAPGLVHVFLGEDMPTAGSALETSGITFSADHDPQSMLGAALCGIPAMQIGRASGAIAIGAPLGRDSWGDTDDTSRRGVTYVVFATSAFGYPPFSPFPLTYVGYSESPFDGRFIIGEQEGDLAGAALAAGDFDGDGHADLLIGAPGADDGRGRVYLLYDIFGDEWPEARDPLYLSLVGSEYPGAVFSGIAAGDAFGSTLTAGDFDGDGRDDLVCGAPTAESSRGAMYLIYGNYRELLHGNYSAAAIGTLELPGFELVGPADMVSRLGAALSAGQTNYDYTADIAIGAPSDANSPGKVYLLTGESYD